MYKNISVLSLGQNEAQGGVAYGTCAYRYSAIRPWWKTVMKCNDPRKTPL